MTPKSHAVSIPKNDSTLLTLEQERAIIYLKEGEL